MRCTHAIPRHLTVAVLITPELAATHSALAQKKRHPEGRMETTTSIRIPESMRAEHQEIHVAFVGVTRELGRVGAAARELASVLHPHFVREEQIALPPLGLLAPLARGEMKPDMREVLPMTDSLRRELPRMLEEHETIRHATIRLGEVARAEGNAAVERLAEQLKLHAQSEEELFYPAALLVGELVRARTTREP